MTIGLPKKKNEDLKTLWSGFGKWQVTTATGSVILYSFYYIRYNIFNCSYKLEIEGEMPTKHPNYLYALDMLWKFEREAKTKK